MNRASTHPVTDADRDELERRKPCRVLGLDVHPFNVDQWNAVLAGRVRRGGQTIVICQNLHGAALLNREPAMRALGEQALVHIDGTPIVWIGRYLLGYPLRREHRVTWLDWVHPLCDTAVREGWRVFYLGSTPEVAQRATQRLIEQHAASGTLRLESHHGYFDMSPGSAENQRVVERINAFRPHLLIVGMGMGRQERWIHRERDRLDARVILTCGALMEYIAGATPTPPRWLGPLGLEWTCRFLTDPRRFAYRYLVEPWRLLPRLAAEVWARRVRGKG